MDKGRIFISDLVYAAQTMSKTMGKTMMGNIVINYLHSRVLCRIQAPKHQRYSYCMGTLHACMHVTIGIDVLLSQVRSKCSYLQQTRGFFARSLARCHLITTMRNCQLAVLRKSFGKDLEFGELHPHIITRWSPHIPNTKQFLSTHHMY